MDLYPSGYWMMIAQPQGMLQRGLSHPLQNENGAVLWSARATTTLLSLLLFDYHYMTTHHRISVTIPIMMLLAPPGCGALLLADLEIPPTTSS